MVGLALTTGGFLASVSAFMVAAGTILTLIAAAAFLTSAGHIGFLARLRTVAPVVKTWTAFIVIVVGVWFLLLAAFADFFAELFPV